MAFSIAVWLLPETICRPLRVTLGTAVALKVTDRAPAGQAGHVALIETAPEAVPEKVAVTAARPFTSVDVLVLERLAAPAGVTVQLTVWPATGVPDAVSTST